MDATTAAILKPWFPALDLEMVRIVTSGLAWDR